MRIFFGSLLLIVLSQTTFAAERLFQDVGEAFNGDVLIRDQDTPDSVEFDTEVVQKKEMCLNSVTQYWTSTCHRYENVQTTSRVCVQTGSGPCEWQTVYSTSRIDIPYECSGETEKCIERGIGEYKKRIKVKVRFKDLPRLVGDEKEKFSFKIVKSKPDENPYKVILENAVAGQDFRIKSKSAFLSSKKIITIRPRQ